MCHNYRLSGEIKCASPFEMFFAPFVAWVEFMPCHFIKNKRCNLPRDAFCIQLNQCDEFVQQAIRNPVLSGLGMNVYSSAAALCVRMGHGFGKHVCPVNMQSLCSSLTSLSPLLSSPDQTGLAEAADQEFDNWLPAQPPHPANSVHSGN